MNNLKNIIVELEKKCDHDDEKASFEHNVGFGDGIDYAIDILEAWQKELKKRLDEWEHRPARGDKLSEIFGRIDELEEVLGE